MRSTFATLLVLLALAAAPAVAEASSVREPSRWGIGFMVGNPTALSVKHWLGGSDAFDIALGGGPGTRLHADYLFGLSQLLSNNRDVNLDLYLGIGGIAGVGNGWCGFYGRGRWRDDYCHHGDGYIGGRVPLGLDFVFRRAPVNIGLEIAPVVAISSWDTGVWLDGSLILRFLL